MYLIDGSRSNGVISTSTTPYLPIDAGLPVTSQQENSGLGRRRAAAITGRRCRRSSRTRRPPPRACGSCGGSRTPRRGAPRRPRGRTP
uniref:Uncharacterized protein n=1 Tax=Triticum urartu TaxID=4572 RepID=A0A8R7UEG5_TRIUA